MIKKIFRSSFFHGALFVTTGYIIGNILNFFFTILVGRYLGPTDYSELVALISYISLFTVPTTVIGAVIVQKVSSAGMNGMQTARAIEFLFFQLLKKWWVAYLFFGLFIPIMLQAVNISVYGSIIVAPIIAAALLSVIYLSFFQGLHLFSLMAVLLIISPLVKIIGPLSIMIRGGTINTVLFFLLIAFIIPVFIGFAFFRIKASTQKVLNTELISYPFGTLIKNDQVLMTTASILGLTILSNADIMVVKKIFPSHEAGIYGSWSLFAKLLLYAMGPINALALAFFSSDKYRNSHSITLKISVFFVGIIGLFLFMLYSFIAPFLVQILFGSQFNDVIEYLPYAAIFGTLYALITLMNNYFLACKENASIFVLYFMPFYVVLLLIAGKSVMWVMYINIAVSFLLLFSYAVRFLYKSKIHKFIRNL